jgi:hypothetical protein
MSTIWRPGVTILNRLTYPQKLALTSLLFILPLALVLALLLQELNERTRACLRKPLDASTFVTFVQQLLRGAAYVP